MVFDSLLLSAALVACVKEVMRWLLAKIWDLDRKIIAFA